MSYRRFGLAIFVTVLFYVVGIFFIQRTTSEVKSFRDAQTWPTVEGRVMRIEVIEEKYSWIDKEGLDYFKNRLSQAPRDADHALGMILSEAQTKALQDQALSALHFKCDVLWSLLDAIEAQV